VFLSAAASHSKTGDDFIKNQKGAVSRAFIAQHRQELFAWKIKSGIGRYRFNNDRRDLILVVAKCCAHCLGVIERQRDC